MSLSPACVGFLRVPIDVLFLITLTVTDVESNAVEVFRHSFQSLSWTSYLLVLMLAAEGWCIIRRKAQLHKYTVGE